MTKKLTTEEKELRKQSKLAREKAERGIRYFIAIVFLIVGFGAAIRLAHISTDSALICGFVSGIGFAMIHEMKI